MPGVGFSMVASQGAASRLTYPFRTAPKLLGTHDLELARDSFFQFYGDRL